MKEIYNIELDDLTFNICYVAGDDDDLHVNYIIREDEIFKASNKNDIHFSELVECYFDDLLEECRSRWLSTHNDNQEETEVDRETYEDDLTIWEENEVFADMEDE